MNANLRLQDLYGREKEGETKLLALYVPKELTTRIDRLAKDLKAKKREVILALLNEGLDRYHRSKGRRRKKEGVRRPERVRTRSGRQRVGTALCGWYRRSLRPLMTLVRSSGTTAPLVVTRYAATKS